MPQMQLPFYPEGLSHINNLLAFEKREGMITYFNGHMPIFSHLEDDDRTFKMINAQFCVQGTAQQIEIVKAFGVHKNYIKRAVKLYREYGPSGFYLPKATRGSSVLTGEVLAQVQDLLNIGNNIPTISNKLELK